MRKIDRAFAMRVLERLLNKPESQIRKEAAEDKEEWPSGEEELLMSLNSKEAIAKGIVEVLGNSSNRTVTPEVYRAIFRSAGYNKETASIRERDLLVMQRNVDAVFEIYEESDDRDEAL